MIKEYNKLHIEYFDGVSTYTDYSKEMLDFGRDTASITLTSAQKIYIGFEKPIAAFFVEMSTANTNSSTISLKYYNGSAFTAVAGLYDDSNGFARSGFVRWDRNQTSEAKTTIDSVEQYWYELTVDADTSACVFQGLNILFSDDQDLKREVPEITKYYASGASSFVLAHEAARDELIQDLRSSGKYKEDLATGDLKDITAFDLLDISQVKVPSTYLALSKILFAASDDVDDIYMMKSKEYRGLYNKCMDTFYLNLDTDNDGISDDHEEMADNTSVLVRR